nr:hypothetical protein [uncultured Campylobacter sp.]
MAELISIAQLNLKLSLYLSLEERLNLKLVVRAFAAPYSPGF